MGYDSDQFEGEINEELICSICTGVLSEPLTTHCDHLFCSDCIHDWLKDNTSCPIDRCFLRACMLKPAPRVIRNLINRLQIRCDYREDGCPELLPVESYELHVLHCPFNPSRMVICKLWCHKAMTFTESKTHNCLNEVLRRVDHLNRELEQLRSERRYLLIIIALLLTLVLYLLFPPDKIVYQLSTFSSELFWY